MQCRTDNTELIGSDSDSDSFQDLSEAVQLYPVHFNFNFNFYSQTMIYKLYRYGYYMLKY